MSSKNHQSTTIDAKAVRVEESQHDTRNTQQKHPQKGVAAHVRPWVPVIMMVTGLLGGGKMLYDTHLEARDPPEVKIKRLERDIAFAEASKAKYDAERAEAEASGRIQQINIQPNSFPQPDPQPQPATYLSGSN